MRVINRLGIVFDHILDYTAIFSGVLVILLMIGVVANVSARSFGSSIIGTEEVSEYFLLWLTFAGTAWVLKRGKHVMIDVFTNRFSPKVAIALNIALALIAAVIFIFIFWYGLMSSLHYIQTKVYLPQVLKPLRGVVYIIVPIGCLLLAIQLLRSVYNGFTSLMKR